MWTRIKNFFSRIFGPKYHFEPKQKGLKTHYVEDSDHNLYTRCGLYYPYVGQFTQSKRKTTCGNCLKLIGRD